MDNKSSFAQLRIALGCDVLSTCTNEQDFRYTSFGRCKMDIAKELQRLSEMGVGDDVPSCYRKAATYTPNLERQLVRMGVLTSDHFQHIEFRTCLKRISMRSCIGRPSTIRCVLRVCTIELGPRVIFGGSLLTRGSSSNLCT